MEASPIGRRHNVGQGTAAFYSSTPFVSASRFNFGLSEEFKDELEIKHRHNFHVEQVQKKLLAKIARSSENAYDRPSLCQLRIEGKALSYTDLVFVLKQQKKRVRYLIERKGEHGSRYEFLNKQLKLEYERLWCFRRFLNSP